MTLRETGNGEIIASQWIFILGSFITHLLIWLLYGYVARPTREQLAALSRDVQDYLISQNQDYRHGLTRSSDQAVEPAADGLSIHKALNEYIKAQQDEDNSETEGYSAEEDRPESLATEGEVEPSHKPDILSKIDSNAAGNGSGTVAANGKTGHESSSPEGQSRPKPLVANRAFEVASVTILFYDPNSLLSTLALEKSKPYFALCTQLLQRTIDELLKQPILFGIKVNNTPVFDQNGATVEFYGTTEHSKPGLAAMMLAKTYIMLNQVTVMKHHELQRFAIDVVVGVSDKATSDKMEQLLHNKAKANEILTLLPVEGIKQLRGYIQLNSLKNPTTVYERDCALLEGVSDSMMQRLIDVRDAVLLSALN